MYSSTNTYPLIATFFWNHYREALKVIYVNSTELEQVQASLGITNDDFEEYLQDERTYLFGLKSEPLEEKLRFQYIEALRDCTRERYTTAYGPHFFR
jgi:hypothetical protein